MKHPSVGTKGGTQPERIDFRVNGNVEQLDSDVEFRDSKDVDIEGNWFIINYGGSTLPSGENELYVDNLRIVFGGHP